MSRLRLPDALAGVFGVGLLVSLLLPWYAGSTAAETFGIVDGLFVVVALMGILLTVITAVADAPARPVAVDVLTWFTALAGLIGLVYRLLDAPAHDWGLWVGAACVVGVFGSAHRAIRREDTRGLRANPEPQRMPSPPAS